jgi:hypothetical protein
VSRTAKRGDEARTKRAYVYKQNARQPKRRSLADRVGRRLRWEKLRQADWAEDLERDA